MKAEALELSLAQRLQRKLLVVWNLARSVRFATVRFGWLLALALLSGAPTNHALAAEPAMPAAATAPVTLTIRPDHLMSFGETYHFGAAMVRGPHVQVYIDGLLLDARAKTIVAQQALVNATPNDAALASYLKNLKNAQRAHQFFEDVGLGKQITTAKPPVDTRASDSTRLVAEGFEKDPSYAARLRNVFLGREPIPTPIRNYADLSLGGLQHQKLLLIWNRSSATGFGADRSMTQEILEQLVTKAKASGQRPVVVGEPLTPDAKAIVEARGGTVMTEHWKHTGSGYRQQLQLFEYLQQRYGATQIGMKSGGLDGPAFMGMPTQEIVDARGSVHVQSTKTPLWIEGKGKAPSKLVLDMRSLDEYIVKTGAADDVAAKKVATFRFIHEQARIKGLDQVPADAKLEHERMMTLENRLPGFRIVGVDEAVAPPQRPGACEPPPNAPKFVRSPSTVAKGGPLVVLASVAGKVVEHETDSPALGMATTVSVGLGPAVLKYGPKGLRGVGPVIVGSGVQWGVTETTGNQQAGEVSGYLTSAAFGAYVGGPWGAVIAVSVHGTANLGAAGVDLLYAHREGAAIDENMVRQLYFTVLGRKGDDGGVRAHVRAVSRGAKYRDIKDALANSDEASNTIDQMFLRTIGRKPLNDAEREAARTLLKERHIGVLEFALQNTPQAQAHRAKLAHEAELKRDVDGFFAANRQRVQLIYAVSRNVNSLKRGLAEDADALRRSTAKQGTPEFDWSVLRLGDTLAALRQQERMVEELEAEGVGRFPLSADEAPKSRKATPQRDARDAEFVKAWQQSKVRLLQGELGKSVDTYTDAYRGERDPFRRAMSGTQNPFQRYSAQGRLESYFGRVNESPEEWAANASFWKQQRLDAMDAGVVPVTPKSAVLSSLGR